MGHFPGRVVPVAGEVRAHFVGAEAPPIIAVADEEGHFGFELPDGRYQLSATSPSYYGGMAICEGGEIAVVANAIQRATGRLALDPDGIVVDCPMK